MLLPGDPQPATGRFLDSESLNPKGQQAVARLFFPWAYIMRIAIVTAGGAGMFCGSCMHDNAWARALRKAGEDVWLIPTYTPLTLDESDQSETRVFLGGINVYLEHRSRLWRALPDALTRWVDSPAVIRAATRFGVSNEAKDLGDLTLDMLRGEHGHQKQDIQILVQHLVGECRPDAILFSNLLLSGIVKPLRDVFTGPIWSVLQGDDIFLNGLPPDYRARAIQQISTNARYLDGVLTHSDFYTGAMSALLEIPIERFRRVPLSISFDDHLGTPDKLAGDPFTIGYFARICPEKGVHNLIEAFRLLHARHPRTRLVVGGYLGKRDFAYWKRLLRETRDLGEAFEHAGSPSTMIEKVQLLGRFDLLSVPTTYQEPKGLYVLEALANGVPVVQPDHGSFPEMLRTAGGGRLYPAGDVAAHAGVLEELYLDGEQRLALARQGHAGVRAHFSEEVLVAATRAMVAEHSGGGR